MLFLAMINDTTETRCKIAAACLSDLPMYQPVNQIAIRDRICCFAEALELLHLRFGIGTLSNSSWSILQIIFLWRSWSVIGCKSRRQIRSYLNEQGHKAEILEVEI